MIKNKICFHARVLFLVVFSFQSAAFAVDEKERANSWQATIEALKPVIVAVFYTAFWLAMDALDNYRVRRAQVAAADADAARAAADADADDAAVHGGGFPQGPQAPRARFAPGAAGSGAGNVVPLAQQPERQAQRPLLDADNFSANSIGWHLAHIISLEADPRVAGALIDFLRLYFRQTLNMPLNVANLSLLEQMLKAIEGFIESNNDVNYWSALWTSAVQSPTFENNEHTAALLAINDQAHGAIPIVVGGAGFALLKQWHSALLEKARLMETNSIARKQEQIFSH